MCYHTVKWKECEEVNDITKLELVAAIGPNQLELVQVYLRGLLSAIELEKLIGKQKAKIVDVFYNRICAYVTPDSSIGYQAFLL